MFLAALLLAQTSWKADLEYLHQVARQVVDSATVLPGETIPGGTENATGSILRVPGGTRNYYPAFWVRDAAMMLGSDLVPATEIEGWIKVIAKTQPGPGGIDFPHGLHVPPFSIPDHVALDGRACWYPGAYAEQGVGNYGYLPPADDASFFVQMACEHYRLTKNADFLRAKVQTGWGQQRVYDVCLKALSSLELNPKTHLVSCSAVKGQGRVDWGFCDSIKKTGDCLMPTLLQLGARRQLNRVAAEVGLGGADGQEERTVVANLVEALYMPLPNGRGMLLSSTGLGRKDDIWASAYAVWLGILPADIEKSVALHLLDLFRRGRIVAEGQVRELPVDGKFGGYWESMGRSTTYQNGGYWATPTGWLAVALDKVDPDAARSLVHELVEHIRAFRSAGAPFEWINPSTGARVNGNYGSSAGLVYNSIVSAGLGQ